MNPKKILKGKEAEFSLLCEVLGKNSPSDVGLVHYAIRYNQ